MSIKLLEISNLRFLNKNSSVTKKKKGMFYHDCSQGARVRSRKIILLSRRKTNRKLRLFILFKKKRELARLVQVCFVKRKKKAIFFTPKYEKLSTHLSGYETRKYYGVLIQLSELSPLWHTEFWWKKQFRAITMGNLIISL